MEGGGSEDLYIIICAYLLIFWKSHTLWLCSVRDWKRVCRYIDIYRGGGVSIREDFENICSISKNVGGGANNVTGSRRNTISWVGVSSRRSRCRRNFRSRLYSFPPPLVDQKSPFCHQSRWRWHSVVGGRGCAIRNRGWSPFLPLLYVFYVAIIWL